MQALAPPPQSNYSDDPGARRTKYARNPPASKPAKAKKTRGRPRKREEGEREESTEKARSRDAVDLATYRQRRKKA